MSTASRLEMKGAAAGSAASGYAGPHDNPEDIGSHSKEELDDFFTGKIAARDPEHNGPSQPSSNTFAGLSAWEDEEPWEFRARPSTVEEKDFDISRRIYVLGMGATGCFVAHSLRQLVNPPPITLLCRRRADLVAFDRQKKGITIHRGEQVDWQPGFGIEALRNMSDLSKKGISEKLTEDAPILNLIVTVKAKQTVQALRNIAHRLVPDSTICLIQNGVGQTNEVISELFPDPETRPTFIAGINSHGLYRPRQFHTEHRGRGNIVLSIIDRYKRKTPSEKNSDAAEDAEQTSGMRRAYWSKSARYIMRNLTRSLTLSAVGVKPHDLYVFQLEKLAVNAVINPLTAIYQCRNGELLSNRHMTATMRLMIAEISLVLRSLPELRDYFPPSGTEPQASGRATASSDSAPSQQRRQQQQQHTMPDDIHYSVGQRLSPETLEYSVRDVATKTQHNESSMMVDAREGRETEIEYINGYIVRRGEELGIKCIVNYTIMTMLQARINMSWRRSRQLAYDENWSQVSPEVKDMLRPNEE